MVSLLSLIWYVPYIAIFLCGIGLAIAQIPTRPGRGYLALAAFGGFLAGSVVGLVSQYAIVYRGVSLGGSAELSLLLTVSRLGSVLLNCVAWVFLLMALFGSDDQVLDQRSRGEF